MTQIRPLYNQDKILVGWSLPNLSRLEDRTKKKEKTEDMLKLLHLASVGFDSNATEEDFEKYLKIETEVILDRLQEVNKISIPYFLTKKFPGFDYLAKPQGTIKRTSYQGLEQGLIADANLLEAYRTYHKSL